MVILLQLCILLAVVSMRGRHLFGSHLVPTRTGSEVLTFSRRFGITITAKNFGISQQDGIPFIIRRERWYHRALRALGIASEIGAGNTSSGQRYFIVTDYPGHLERLLASGHVRLHLQQLFRMPVKSLHATPHKIWCVIEWEDVSKPDDHFSQHLALLRQISEATCASISRKHALPAPHKHGLDAVFIVAGHAGLLTLGVFGVISVFAGPIDIFDRRTLIVFGAVAGGVAAGAWLLGILTAFRGSSWGPWVVCDFLLCGILGFVLSGIVFVREANIRLPQAVASFKELPVISKVCVLECMNVRHISYGLDSYRFDSDRDCSPHSREAIMASKRQTNGRCASQAAFVYRVQIKHWREPGNFAFSPSAEVFDRFSTGSVLRVPVHAGALGFQWVDMGQFHVR